MSRIDEKETSSEIRSDVSQREKSIIVKSDEGMDLVKRVLSMSPEERQAILAHEDDPEYSDSHYYTPEGELRLRVTDLDLRNAGISKRFIENRKKKKISPKYVEFFREWIETWKYRAEPTRPLKGFFFNGSNLDEIEDIVFTLMGSVLNRCWTAYTISAPHLVTYCKDQNGSELLTEVSLLTVLDFGHQYRDKEGYCDSFFIDVLTKRFREGKPTFIVSGFPLDKLKRQFDSFSGGNLIQVIERSTQEISVEAT